MRKTIRINNEQQLMSLVNLANTFEDAIDLSKGNHVVDCKSILGAVSLGLYGELEIGILSANEDEIIRFDKEIEAYKAI